MRRPATLVLLGAMLLTAGAGIGAVAQEESEPVRIEAVDAAAHPDVQVRVSVPFDAAGEVPPPTAFRLLENGDERTTQISALSTGNLQVLLLIDTTGSMAGEPMEVAQAAATGFVRSLPDDVQIAVLDYDVDTRVVTPFSTDKQAHVAGIQRLEPDGHTATYDAIGVALDTFPADSRAQQVIVLLTDGQDNASSTALDAAVRQVADSGVTLYAINFMTDQFDMRAIEQLVAAGHGQAKPADDPESLTHVYTEIAAQLTNQYALAYRSEAEGRTELTVRFDHAGVVGTATEMVDLPGGAAPGRVGSAVGFLGTTTAMVLALGALYVAFVVVVVVLLTPGPRRARLRAPMAGARARIKGISQLSDWLTGAADQTLQRRGWASRLNTTLEQAGVNLRPAEFSVLVACAALVAGAGGRLVGGALIGFVFAAATVVLARVALSFLAGRRKAKFADQLGDTLQLLAGSLRAGYSIMQAVDAVAREADTPTAEEFRRLIVETRLGRAPNEALDAMAHRLESEDFEWVVQAIEIQREIGGDLAEVLDTVAATIRERNQIRRQVKALSAEGRLSALVLFCLPFGLGAFLMVTNRDYLDELFVTLPGRVMLGMGAMLMAFGAVWLRKIVRIEF